MIIQIRIQTKVFCFRHQTIYNQLPISLYKVPRCLYPDMLQDQQRLYRFRVMGMWQEVWPLGLCRQRGYLQWHFLLLNLERKRKGSPWLNCAMASKQLQDCESQLLCFIELEKQRKSIHLIHLPMKDSLYPNLQLKRWQQIQLPNQPLEQFEELFCQLYSHIKLWCYANSFLPIFVLFLLQELHYKLQLRIHFLHPQKWLNHDLHHLKLQFF